MDLSKVALAARNNACWCDAVCRAHGQATEFTSGLWRCLGTPPRFYPGAVSLATGTAPIVSDHRPVAFKDSFHDVDLSGHGYAVAFEATWIWREASDVPSSFLRWETVASDDRLRVSVRPSAFGRLLDGAMRAVAMVPIGIGQDVLRWLPVERSQRVEVVLVGHRGQLEIRESSWAPF